MIPNRTYTYTIKATNDIPNAPYNLEKFKNVLDASKLQWQSSVTNKFKIINDFDGVVKDYFYLTQNRYMNLKTQNEGNKRVELRQKQTWDSHEIISMSADIKCFYPESIKEYTWMQIFDESAKKPRLRLIWRRLRKGKENSLWAFLKVKDGEKKIDLGTNPNTFFHINLSIYHQMMTVTIGDKVVLDENISYWGNKNYFKAGVYLSGGINDDVDDEEKSALVQFETLVFE